MTLTLRDTKGSALTYAEMDANFTHIDLYKSVENVTGGGALSTSTVVSFISTMMENQHDTNKTYNQRIISDLHRT